MCDAAVIGDIKSIYGFSVTGARICAADTAEEAAEVLEELKNDGCAVVFITETLAELMPEELAKYREMYLPSVVPIPDVKGSRGIGRRNIKESMIRSVGSDLGE